MVILEFCNEKPDAAKKCFACFVSGHFVESTLKKPCLGGCFNVLLDTVLLFIEVSLRKNIDYIYIYFVDKYIHLH